MRVVAFRESELDGTFVLSKNFMVEIGAGK